MCVRTTVCLRTTVCVRTTVDGHQSETVVRVHIRRSISLRSAFIKSSQSGHFVIKETEIMYIYHANLSLEQFRKIFSIRTGCYKIANSFDESISFPG